MLVIIAGIYILAMGRVRKIVSKLKNREEFEGGLKKTEEFEETSNKSPKKQARISTGGGTIFLAGKNIYPCIVFIRLPRDVFDP